MTSLPIIVDADGHPLGISLSEARHIVALDGHVFVALSTAANVTLTLKITAPDGLIDTSFITSRLMGKELLTGSTSECLYQVTLVGDNGGQGIVNLCDNLVRVYILWRLHVHATRLQNSVAQVIHYGHNMSAYMAIMIFDSKFIINAIIIML